MTPARGLPASGSHSYRHCMRFTSQVALITGAGSGIGAAIARRLADEGAHLVLNDLRRPYLDELIGELPGEHRAIEGDISMEETAQAMVASALEAWGRIDVLITNVGLMHFGDVTQTSVEDWDRVMSVNVRGQFLACKHVLPTMVEQHSGAIVNVASVSAFVGQQFESEEGVLSSFAYNASKAAGRQLATSLATRYARDGIRVNSVVPGTTRTNQLRHFLPDLEQDEENGMWHAGDDAIPLGRFAKPEEIAAVAAFLASHEASFVTGAAWVADGGVLAT